MLHTIKSLWQQKRNLLALVKADFTQNHLSSYLGFAWAIIGPMVSLVVIALVFQFGLKASSGQGEPPFVPWLACGFIPWFFIADALQSGATTIVSYSFLVRKALFRISYLPAIRLCSSSLLHGCLLMLLGVILFLYGGTPSWYWLQLFFYFPLLYLLLLGINWSTSAVAVFIPDINGVLGIIVNLGFWATPIMWKAQMLPQEYHWIFTINPAYYIIQGYRQTFLEAQWFWQRPVLEHVVFFAWLFFALLLGAYTFKKLRPHFADVL